MKAPIPERLASDTGLLDDIAVASDNQSDHSPEERLRRSHCERRNEAHECLGSITITPRGYELSCPLCGSTNREPSYPTEIHERARELAGEFGLRWELLSIEVQQAVLSYLHHKPPLP